VSSIKKDYLTNRWRISSCKLYFFLKSWLLKSNNLLLVLILIIFAIKLPFIFHGKWDKDFFLPYMTDENCYSSPIHSLIASGKVNINDWMSHCAYPPFFLHLLLPYFVGLFKILLFFNVKLDLLTVYEIIYYNCRFFVLIIATIGSYFFVKLFDELIKSKFFQSLLLILINLSPLFFLYSTFIKADEIVWALGIISLYYGLIFWREKNLSNYKKFYVTSILPLLFAYNGYLYFLNFIFVSLFVIKKDLFYHKILFIFLGFICTPLIWIFANFEMFTKGGVLGFLNSMRGMYGRLNSSPFMIGANGVSSFNFYTELIKANIANPIIILIALGLFIFKTKYTYFKIVTVVFGIFFTHLSLSAYRTDRIFLPIYIFFLFLVIYLLYFLYEKLRGNILKSFVIFLTILFTYSILSKTSLLANALASKDTRQAIFEYIYKHILRRSEISFIHLTTAGATSVSQRLVTTGKEYKIKVIYIDEKEKANDLLSNLTGYFILSAIDYDILDDFKETSYYSEQYGALKELLERSEQVEYFDKINYQQKPFGPFSVSSSLYGIHNPPLYLYRTNNTSTKEIVYRESELPYKISQKQGKEIIITLDKFVISTLGENGKEVQIDPVNWKTTEQRTIKLEDGVEAVALFVSNNSNNPINIFQPYLGLDKNGVDLGYGFADKRYEGKELLFTTWIKANKPDCVALGFYKGNVTASAWGDSNLLGVLNNKYELLSYDGEFDKPYTLNGQAIYRLNSGCEVELALPQFFLFDSDQ